MPTLRSDQYWEARSAQRMAQYHRDELNTINAVTQAYDTARDKIGKEIAALFQRYSFRFGLSTKEAVRFLNEKVSQKQLNALAANIASMDDGKQKLDALARLNAQSYKFRISQLEALRQNAVVTCMKAAQVELKLDTKSLIKTAKDAYLRSEYDEQIGVEVGLKTSGISDRKVQFILREKWSTEHYSDRIWSHNADLNRDVSKAIKTEILQGLLGGKGYKQVTKDIGKAFTVSKYNAARLLATETSYIANASEMERYKDRGIKEYIFLAKLDDKTSETCQDRDTVIYQVANAKVGVNFPPMHPWCRSTTGAVHNRAWLDRITRLARNENGGFDVLPLTMNYAEWKEKYYDKRVKE